MVLPIYLYGQPVLRETAQVVDLNEKAEIDKLVQDLWDTLAVADGCGLAAPQVTYLMHSLKEKGYDVDTDVITVEEARKELARVFGKKGGKR